MSSVATHTLEDAEQAALAAAGDLFYRYGIAGVTMAQIRDRSGLACKVTLPKASNEDVLSIPQTCVLDDDGKICVFLRDADGTVTRKEVKLGDKAAGRVQVVEGLKAGQMLLKSPPNKDSEGK